MLQLSPSPKALSTSDVRRICRRCLRYGVLLVCLFAVVCALTLEPYQIPTGSMAPALRGNHRVCTCPRCGQEIVVGRSSAETEPNELTRLYRKAFCPNCGLISLPIDESAEVQGNRILVNKAAFLVRSPRRWEVIVFRILGTYYIKRLLGLPTEDIQIHDGDVYVNGRLQRKSFAQAKTMRLLVFDQDHAPYPEGWKCRWEQEYGLATAAKLVLDGRATPRTLTYRNYLLESAKSEPLRDEYAYNASVHADSECVHDFMIETEIETSAGRGSVALRLCDGHDWVEVLLPVGEERATEAFHWPLHATGTMKKLSETDKTAWLKPGRRYRVELAFVDRRLSLAVDGQVWLSADLPAIRNREGVERPFQMQADGVRVVLHSFRLYRDIHYGQQGRNAVRGKSVRLGVDQYFVLGDNSPNSQDSRFWPDEGRVSASCLVGSAWLVYGSSPLRQLP